MNASTLPLFDVHGNAVLDSAGNTVFFTEQEARVMIGQMLATVRHGRAKRGKAAVRYLVLRVTHEHARKMSRVERFQETISHRSRAPITEPYCVAEAINGSRVYAHVAHRCSAVAPNRTPVDAGCM